MSADLRCIAAALAWVACGNPSGGGGDAGGPDVPDPELVIDSVEPPRGPYVGGTEVVVRGAGFAGGVELRFGGRPAPMGQIEIIDDNTLRAITPAGLPGLTSVSASRGAIRGAREEAFAFEAGVVEPAVGSSAGGELVVVTTLGLSSGEVPTIELGGAALSKVERLAPGIYAGVTSSAAEGAVELRVDGESVAQEAFEYLPAPVVGMTEAGGGALDGALGLRVFGAASGAPLSGASVDIAGVGAEVTSADGRVAFDGVVSPAIVTVSAAGYETFRAFDVDRESLHVALRPRAQPATVAATTDGQISGAIRLEVELPERPPGAKLVAIVIPSADSPYATYAPRDVVDLDADEEPGYSLAVEPGVRALLCAVGYQHESGFQPVAFGVLRRLVVGDDDFQSGVDIAVTRLVDGQATVELVDPPSVGGDFGVTAYALRLLVDLGAEGVLPAVQPLAQTAVSVNAERVIFPDDQTTVVLDAVLPLRGPLDGALYTAVAGAHAGGAASPLSVRVVRGIEALDPLAIGDFIGTPRAVDPQSGEVASGNELILELDPVATGAVTFSLQRLSDTWGEKLHWVQAAGDRAEVALPDGATRPPGGEDLSWTMLAVRHLEPAPRTPSSADLHAEHWTAYALSSAWVRFPQVE